MEKITRFKISNFKRFHEFSIHMPENELILCGENGSGKTQILWAFLLFFRGVNMESTKFLQKFSNYLHTLRSLNFLIMKVSFILWMIHQMAKHLSMHPFHLAQVSK